MFKRAATAMLVNLFGMVPALADDQPYLDDLSVTMGRVVREGTSVDVNISLKSDAPTRLRFVSIGCSALSNAGDALDTAPVTLENVSSGATVRGTALFNDIPHDAHFECRVESYDE